MFISKMKAVVINSVRWIVVLPVVALLASTSVPCGFASPATVPAFLWSPDQHLRLTDNKVKESVNYQAISPKELVNSVMSDAGWSNLLCSGKKFHEPLDLALVFIGNKLQSTDISAHKQADQDLLNLLKVSFTKSNFSMAFPYVYASGEETMEKLLVSGFEASCEHGSGISKVAFLGRCSEDGENKKDTSFHSVEDYLISRTADRSATQTDLVVFCSGGAHALGEVDHSESEIFSELISSLEQSGTKYTALYVSDPVRRIEYPSYMELGRFLAEGASGNASANFTLCDEVCKIKSSLLEGVLVGIVLLIILISGLCCMMGIDTPTRFEAPQES